MISGILNVDKPVGETSFAVVRRIRRLTRVDPIGHGGTLDPAASGVLPILIGRATRLADFVHEWPKTYLATLQLGATSDTDDREGRITPAGDPSAIRAEDVETALPRFRGTIHQVPPVYSALKQGGEALYRRARRGEVIEPSAREVRVECLRLMDFDVAHARVQLEVVSGKGMYVRSLARDLGVALGCGAYLGALIRTAVGPLHLDEAIRPDALERAADAWRSALLSMDLPLRDWPALTIDEDRVRAIERGQVIAVPEAQTAGRHRLMDRDGHLLAWGTVDATGHLRPRAVFAP